MTLKGGQTSGSYWSALAKSPVQASNLTLPYWISFRMTPGFWLLELVRPTKHLKYRPSELSEC